MPAKWQQWMPLYIDRFLGSPDVQLMEPAAFKGYICLLLAAWQTDGCMLSSDEHDLARTSRLGVKLWKRHRAEILRKFSVLADGLSYHYRNDVEYEIWLEAKRIFEARNRAAQNTNATRSPKRSPSDTAPRSPSRSAAHSNNPLQEQEQEQGEENAREALPPSPAPLGVAECVRPDWEADPAANIPEGLSLVQYANFACDELQAARGNRKAMENAIEAIAQHEGKTLAQATATWIQRAKEHPPAPGKSWTFHVNDGGWKAKEKANAQWDEFVAAGGLDEEN